LIHWGLIRRCRRDKELLERVKGPRYSGLQAFFFYGSFVCMISSVMDWYLLYYIGFAVAYRVCRRSCGRLDYI
jgi:hypothetical protein